MVARTSPEPEPLNILLGEEQVVRTGFDRYIDAPRPGFGSRDNTASRADMNDVKPRFRLPRHERRALNRFEFREHGARAEEILN